MTDFSFPVLQSVRQLLDWGMTAVTFMIIYYVIKLFFVASSPEAEEKAKAEDAKMSELVETGKRKIEESKATKETASKQKQREALLGPAKGFLIKAAQYAEELRDDELTVMNDAALRSAQRKAANLESNLKSAKRVLRTVHLAAKGELKDPFLDWYDSVASIAQYYKDNLENNLPTNARDTRWNNKVIAVKTAANNIRGFCGAVISKIDMYISTEKAEKAAVIPGTSSSS